MKRDHRILYAPPLVEVEHYRRPRWLDVGGVLRKRWAVLVLGIAIGFAAGFALGRYTAHGEHITSEIRT